uniref:Uncharacterized protein n=1 Tax=Chenopodium quinoa TaxID=63459 RepID=A0A803LDY6_CHEQI
MFDELEDQLRGKGRAEFGLLNDVVSLEFVFRLFCDGKSPSDTKLQSKGPSMFKKWLICQLAPLKTLGSTKLLIPIDDFILHSIRLPFFLVKGDYKKLWFPLFIKWVASGGETLHCELAKEIRAAVRCEGRVTLNAINKMALTKSVVYEALRIEPPVPYQYGLAKDDLIIHSHDALFKIKKGEMIFGYQPFATKDPKIFNDPDKFIGFVGEKREQLLKYVLWSNGRGIDDPTMIISNALVRIWWSSCLEFSWRNSSYAMTHFQLKLAACYQRPP